jgi:hypothetical protein
MVPFFSQKKFSKPKKNFKKKWPPDSQREPGGQEEPEQEEQIGKHGISLSGS